MHEWIALILQFLPTIQQSINIVMSYNSNNEMNEAGGNTTLIGIKMQPSS